MNAVKLRPVVQADEPFLEALYADVHGPEFAALPEESRTPLLRSQHQFQTADYRSHYPNADHQMILQNGDPIGRLLVDRTPGTIHLVDVSLIGAGRGNGIGTWLLEQLVRESESGLQTLTLHVAATNPARRLYERLGFTATGSQGPFLEMARKPDA